MSLSAALTSIIHRAPQTQNRVNHVAGCRSKTIKDLYKKVKRAFGLLCATKHLKLSLTLILSQQASTNTVSVH